MTRKGELSVHFPRGEVHIWRIELDVPATSLKMLEVTLSREERQRANSLRTAQMGNRWTVARGALRCILSTYVRSQPSYLVFQTTRFGKPHLSWPTMNIPFNLSHTGGLAFLAISADGRVGIDAELVHPMVELERMSRRFFAASEADEILRLPLESRLSAFFACWSRKEAFVKAIGKGLQIPLDQFRVTVKPEEAPRLVSLDWYESSTWSLSDIAEPGIAATVAVDGPPPEIRRFEFAIGSYLN